MKNDINGVIFGPQYFYDFISGSSGYHQKVRNQIFGEFLKTFFGYDQIK